MDMHVAASQAPARASDSSPDALVLDADLRQSLVTIRSLGRRGLRAAALESKSGVPAFASRWCWRAYHAPALGDDAERYLASLEEIIQQIKPRVLIASSDASVDLLRHHRTRLEHWTRVALADEPALGVAISKEQTLKLAQRLGCAVPRGILLRSPRDIISALREIGLPAVVKPECSWVWTPDGGKRLTSRLVATPTEARHAMEELASYGIGGLLQQFLTGRCEGVHLLYAHGSVRARCAQWAKRMHPPLGGVSVLRQSIAMPDDIGPIAERLVCELGLEGYSEVEFRRGANGTPYLMEINPRLSASVEIAVRAGIDFPYLLFRWANGDPIAPVEGYRQGIWMRHLGGDVQALWATLAQRGHPGVRSPIRAFPAFMRSCFLPAGYDYVDWRDPLPAVCATAGFLRHATTLSMRALRRHTFPAMPVPAPSTQVLSSPAHDAPLPVAVSDVDAPSERRPWT